MCYITKLCTNKLYDMSDCAKDTNDYIENVHCCVCDLNERDDDHGRCCVLSRSNKNKCDLGFGYAKDINGKSQKKSKKFMMNQFLNKIKFILNIQTALWIIFALFLLFASQSTMFYFLTSEQFLQENGYVATESEQLTEKQYEDKIVKLDERIKEEKQSENSVLQTFHAALSNLFGDGSTATEKDKQLAEDALMNVVNKKSQRIASMKPPVFLSYPSRAYGSSIIAFMMYLFMIRYNNLTSLLNQTIGSMVWYACISASLIMSAIYRDGGSESTIFMTLMLIVCVIMFIFWFCMRDLIKTKISHQKNKNQKRKNKRSTDSNISTISNEFTGNQRIKDIKTNIALQKSKNEQYQINKQSLSNNTNQTENQIMNSSVIYLNNTSAQNKNVNNNNNNNNESV